MHEKSGLIKLNIVTAVFGDKSRREFTEFLNKEMKGNMEKFTMFDRKVHRLDKIPFNF